jgi:DNA-binding CsgD family transcriptional regulator
MSGSLNGAVLELHAGCRLRTVDEFKDWALDLASSVVPFKRAHWANGALVDGGVFSFDARLRGLHADYERRFNELNRLDKRGMQAVAQPGVTLLRDGHDPLDTPVEFRCHVLDPSGVRYGAVTGILGFPSGVVEGIALMRGSDEGPFTEGERLLVQALVPHMHHARIVNQIERASDVLDSGVRASYHTLVSSNSGLIIATEAEAMTMMLLEWPDWQGGLLPAPLVEAIAAAIRDGGPSIFRGKRLVTRLHPDPDKTLVRMRAPSVVDSLGQRELSVAERYAAGSSYKEIAQLLQLSPSTVSNQLSVVFTKLGVSNKSELARQLDQWR